MENTSLVDAHGRTMKKLRLNLLDACNMRCRYCMPEDQTFKKLKDLLTPLQMKDIVSNLIPYGVDEVRLTGGEPLMHPQFKEIIKELSTLNLRKLSVTTNAILLNEHLDFLEENNVKSVNVSLDSLQAESFHYITRKDVFNEVMSAILNAKARGFNVKINCVMLKNINYEEIENFLTFSAQNDIEVRFLEMMKIGQALQYYDRHFVSAEEAITNIITNWELTKIQMPKDSTSFNYIAKNSSNGDIAKIGFIASESKPFCNDCSRLRLSNQGTLRPCIMINEGPNLTDVTVDNYELILNELINKKPFTRLEGTTHQMNEIGG